MRRTCLILCFLLGLSATARGADRLGVAPFVAEYFQQYCHRCHGPDTQKGDRRLDRFPRENLADDDDAAELLEEALDAINRGDMPPKKKNVTQPPTEQTRRVVAWVTEFLQNAAGDRQPTTTVLRRLNRFEYRNTLRDLLGLHTEAFDPTGDFPVDASTHGFDNNGEALTLSDYQLQRYLEVAEAALDQTVFFGRKQPASQTWSYTGADFNGVHSYERAPVTWRLIVDNDYLEIGHGQPSERHPNFVKRFAVKGGAPADGWYVIRVRAAAANRLNHGYDHQEFERFQKFPLKLALWIAPEFRLLNKNAADHRRLVRVWDLPDGQPKTFTQKVWLGKGSIPFVSWTNGISSKGNIRRVAEKHHPEVIRPTNTQIDAAKLGDRNAKELVERLSKNLNNKLLSEVYHGPRIRVWSLEIEGPTFDQWPPVSHRLLFGEQTDPAKIDIDRIVREFASRAFRRPVKTVEVEHYAAFIRERIRNGEAPGRAIKWGLAAVLTSPRFLHLDEGDDEKEAKLKPFELASRLSYFLWSSMPDAPLLQAAMSGKLSEREELARQVQRMLRDDKARAFVEHFTDCWLRIDLLGSMPPDSKTFETYYRDRLEPLFKQETRLFFADLLKKNGSILNLLDSDYTFLNDALAAHYGIRGVEGEHFRRAALLPEHRRGGLLGQGSVLTLTANGIETSPVVRGVWVLENLLGAPPPPPPPDVEPIEPDTRGVTTIRQQLDKHRNVAACADCHQKIDPAGFALEFFDPIGGYRSRYPARRGKGAPVDGAGKLPSGESFEDERGLKRLLLARKERFAEALTEKLLTYATGRSMTFRDQPEIKKLAGECGENGYGLRDLMIAIVVSETFGKR